MDFKCAIDGGEVPLGEVGREALQGRFGVDTAPGELDRVAGDVCGEDANRKLLRILAEEIRDEHGQRVGLFTGGTARRPDAQLAPRLRLADQAGEYAIAEVGEELGIAEELGHL